MRRTILLAGVLPFVSAFLGGVLAFSFVVPGIVDAQVTRTARASVQDPQLEGSWAVTIEEEDTPTFLVTFMSDGSMVGSNTGRGTAFHGTWVRTGDREFAYTQWRFRFNPSGAYVGREKVRGQVTLNEMLNEYTAPQNMSEVYDADGNLVRSALAAPRRGQRITVELEP